MAEEAGLRIEELAASTGLSTRNVRAYQSMGLLPGPELVGRVGQYGASHVDRLRAIARLQALGFSLAGIKILFDAHERGASLSAVLGLGRGRSVEEVAARPPGPLRLALVPGPLAPVPADVRGAQAG